MGSTAIFPTAPLRSGMYESFYLRAVSPSDPVGVWIRHTIHKRPGRQPTGSVWCTVFDARLGAPFMHKLTSPAPASPPEDWIEVAGSRMGPGRAEGACGPARWSLRFASQEPELRHLAPDWLYRAPLPRTKLTSPAPAASFDGVLEIDGREAIELRGWPGMVGHNWGSEHAERWIWLHGIAFDDAPGTWMDVALGRLKVAGLLTPWVANGALSLDGSRHRIGGLRARGLRVQESVRGCVVHVVGRNLELEARVEVPDASAAGWRYADPDGGEHDVMNCSVASIELLVKLPAGHDRTLRAAHGGTYELGMRTLEGTAEREHGIPIAPFSDG